MRSTPSRRRKHPLPQRHAQRNHPLRSSPPASRTRVIGLANVIVQSQYQLPSESSPWPPAATHSKLEGFAFLPINELHHGAAPRYAGQNLGARAYDRAKKGARFGVLSAVILAELIGFALYLLIPQLAALFSDTPEVIRLATRQARTIAPFYCLLAFSHAVASVCRGAGKAFVPMLVMLAIWCVLRIGYITLVMRFTHELRFIYYAYPLTWAISSVTFYLLSLLRLGPRIRKVTHVFSGASASASPRLTTLPRF